MYKRLSAVMFPVMTLFFLGSIYWGYQEHQEKNSILIKAENQYQRAFHDLSYHVQQLQTELGNTLAVGGTSEGYQRKGLVNVWRLTSQAQNEINQLPLTLLPFNRTEDFLSRIANFTYKASVRDLTKEPLSKDEMGTLKSLYQNAEQISKDLQDVQGKVLASNLRWMDVEVALASEKSNNDNSIIDGFRQVDKKVSEYPELNWGPSVTSMYQKRTLRMLGGPKKTAEDIKKLAAAFAGADEKDIRVVENGKGTEYATFTATVEKGKENQRVQMDFSQDGGHLIYFMNTRAVKNRSVSYEKAAAAASKFLEKHDYKGMEPAVYDEYDHVAVFTYVGTQDGVLIYPEKVIVKVALDNGGIVGLQAGDYVYEHHDRTIPKPAISAAEARKALHSDMKVKSEKLAIILNDENKEVLCHEFTGSINKVVYRIYINADTGSEEAVEKLP